MKHRKTTVEIPNRLVEGWENAEKAFDENSDLLSERTFSLATGGLALSFTVISFIVGDNKLALGWQALAIWSFYLACIIADTISIVIARVKASKLEALFAEKIQKGEKMTAKEVNSLIDTTNKPIRIINTIVFCCLLLVMIWTAIYCYSLLSKLS